MKPDYALGYEMLVLLVSSAVLVWLLPGLGVWSGAALVAALIGVLIGLNSWLQVRHGLVLPLAGSVLMVLLTAAVGLLGRSWDFAASGGLHTTQLARLCALYGVDRIATEQDRKRQPGWVWQELDRLRLHPGDPPVAIFTPLGPSAALSSELRDELRLWQQALRAWRAQDWDACDVHLLNLQRLNAKKVLYRLYAQRVASRRRLPLDPAWDGATPIETLQAPQPGTGAAGHTKPNSP